MNNFMGSMFALLSTLTEKYKNKKFTVTKLEFTILKYPDKTAIIIKPDKASSDIAGIMVDVLRSTAEVIKGMDSTANITITEKNVND